jgi:hypothetical protein
VQRGREVVEEEGESIVHRSRLDHVVIVEDQHQLRVALGQLVDQHRHQHFVG